jgi:hypothetical protein
MIHRLAQTFALLYSDAWFAGAGSFIGHRTLFTSLVNKCTAICKCQQENSTMDLFGTWSSLLIFRTPVVVDS